MYETSDISLASYLVLKGHKIELKQSGRSVSFVFNSVSKDDVSQFYDDDGGYLTYSNIFRNTKSRVVNTLKGGAENG